MAMRMAAAAAGYKEQEDPKALLAREICSISSIFSSCTHRRRSPASARRGFVDWYLILRVDENVGIDAIRRRYRQLALQLHPDKNGHPKAEVAFKLVSESQKTSFNSERKDNFCKECHGKSLPNLHKTPQYSTQNKSTAAAHQARPRRALIAALQEVQKILKEECRVIDNCLKSTQRSHAGSPLFDPSDGVLFPELQKTRI